MRKVAILYICTGAYVVFWKDFFKSFQKYFLPNCDKEFFVFTDADKIYMEELSNVHKIYQENLGWPDNTLKRFHIFSKTENILKEFDYIYFFNANLVCRQDITEEEFLPGEQESLVAVKHPGWVDDFRWFYTYERNAKSMAYIPYREGQYYICGGVSGGRAFEYLEMIRELKRRIDIDLENGIIARYHDESHWNRYILSRDDVRILDPEYCYPEGYKLPYIPKLLLLNKSNYIDVDKIKNNKKSLLTQIKLYTTEVLRRLFRLLWNNKKK